MALLQPVANAIISLRFGPTRVQYEPAAYGTKVKANFHPESGFTYYPHFHTAQDYAAAAGTPILASEAGTVVFSGWDASGGGDKIAVKVNGVFTYCSNHCSRLLVPMGAKVSRGQHIADVGETGLAHGAHDHFWCQIDETVSGRLEHNYYDPLLFMSGGAYANDPRITPVVAKVSLNGPNINIRTSPYSGQGVIYAVSKAQSSAHTQGIYRVKDNYRITYLTYPMPFKGWFKGDTALGSNLWAEVRLPDSSTRRLFVKKELVHFA